MKANDFTHIKLKEFAQIQERETPEARFWKSLHQVKETALQSAPNSVHFNPAAYGSYIITASTKVSLFDSATDKVQRAYSRFTDDAFSGRFRGDGKLILAGEKTGVVKVFDTQSKSLLRQLRHHTAATRCVRWNSDGLHILSASDDKHVFRWDLATEQFLWSSKSHHSDYVRALDGHPTSPDIFATGSYDHTISLWDSREASTSPSWTVNHGHPVEQCLFTASGSILITIGGNEVKLWDVLQGAGRSALHTFNNHQKNVTSIICTQDNRRLLSAGLDGHVKVYSMQSLEVVHGMKFASPITSLGLSEDQRKLILGFVDGNVMVRNNNNSTKRVGGVTSSTSTINNNNLNNNSNNVANPSSTTSSFAAHKTAEGLSVTDQIDRNLARSSSSSSYLRYHRGAGAVQDYQSSTIVAETARGVHLQSFEKYLKAFSYQKALDSALETKDPVVVITILEELMRRNGLTIALSGRDEVSLEPLLAFVSRYISHARYSSLVVQVVHRLVDIYAVIVGQSERIDELFIRLTTQVRQEVAFQKSVKRVMNSLDCIINVSTMPTTNKRMRSGKEEEEEDEDAK